MRNHRNYNRLILLGIKQREIQRELESWAEEYSVVRAGEHLVFTLKIETVPRVVQKNPFPIISEILKADCYEFFSMEHLDSMGVPSAIATRIANAVRNQYGNDLRFKDMADFVAAHPTRHALRKKILNIGVKCVDEMVRVMRESGIPFDTDL